MILDSKFFVFILFNVLSACFLSSVSAGFIFKAFLYSFIWLFIIYYAISFIKNRFVTESLKSFILVLGIVFSLIDIFGSYYFHLPLSNDLGNILFTTHYKESLEFLHAYVYPHRYFVIGLILIAIGSLKLFSFVPNKPIPLKMASILSVLFLIVEAPHTIATIKKYKEREDLLNADGTMEYIALAKGAYYFGRNISSLRESNNSNQALEKASYSKDYLLKNTGSVENVVLVFGESLNRNFMGVYGYQAPTTPYLNALKEKGSLLVFDNVISPAFYTDKSFTMLLTYANRDNLNQKAWYQYKNLAHILKLSDYKSVWITSQGYGLMWGNSYYQVAKHFDTYIENDKPYDENLAALFKRYYDNERERERVKSVKILLFFT
ncbi:sulfatase-like hydrolase/transferase [Helicobacter pylori]|uniref:sulfatase-like hydrolase/transferase n=1 Tax=Helicobacter pylori TaxID=210 RepID=UPI0004585EAA|nr:sulfatase-like hydrolase/transferase [Helicobacter pylori]AHZ26149.1 metal-dependent hydrolase [Helicobacter pylori J166]AVG83272.1 phosphoethanolamine transferase [Helicobacter pylori]AVG84697.1 phosphoethanolamine transferase [Helicobacter pylori]AVG86179.1 phosphoethanolamine transferase [Helicobacter pylori]AVG87665.1 phosphoethanolamine transferase [Helicobacter pylori]